MKHHDHDFCSLQEKVQCVSACITRSSFELDIKAKLQEHIKISLTECKERNYGGRDAIIRDIRLHKATVQNILDKEEQKLISKINEIFEQDQKDLDEKAKETEATLKMIKARRGTIEELSPLSVIKTLTSEEDQVDTMMNLINTPVNTSRYLNDIPQLDYVFVADESQIKLGEIRVDSKTTTRIGATGEKYAINIIW